MSLAAYNDSRTATILREPHSEDSATPHCGITMFHASSRLFFIYLGNEGEYGTWRFALTRALAGALLYAASPKWLDDVARSQYAHRGGQRTLTLGSARARH